VSHPFEFHPEARAELRQSVEFYERETVGLGREFAAEVRATIEHLLENPLSGSVAQAGTRRKLLQRFPYSLIYLVEHGRITVVAVMHHRREPGWTDRIR
jgi:plasmid stabilization system protein ParE